MRKLPILFTMVQVIANTLKTQVSTHTLLNYIGIILLNRSYALSVLIAALDFTDCRSKQNT